MCRYTCLIIGVISLAACSPRDASVPKVLDSPMAVESNTDLMGTWRSIPQEKLEDTDVNRAVEIAGQMAAQGPQGLEPIFEVLSSKDARPVEKIVATISLGPHVNKTHVSRLAALTNTGNDQTMRGCAIHLLGRIADAEADSRIRMLMEDPDSHVSKEAVFALLRRGDATAVQKVLELWKADTMTDENRNEIILAFPADRAKDNLFIYEEVICNPNIDAIARSHALNLLGMLGNTATVEKIEACLDTEKSPQMRDMMNAAKAAILAREKQPAGEDADGEG